MTRQLLVTTIALAAVLLAPGAALAEALSFETIVSDPEESDGPSAEKKKDGAGRLGFAFRYRLPTGTEPYVTGSLGAASLSYGLGVRQPIRIGPIESLLALGLRQVAQEVDGAAPPTAGIELGVPLGSWWSVDAVGGYQVNEDAVSHARPGDWWARAQLSFRPGL